MAMISLSFDGGKVLQELALASKQTTIGRAPCNDLVIDFPP